MRFQGDGEDHEVYDDYCEYQSSEGEEMDWQQHEHNRIEDEMFAGRPQAATAEAKGRTKADVPDFIKVKRKGEGEASKWYEGTTPGMVFKTDDLGIGYYKDGKPREINLSEAMLPMRNCTPMKLMVSEILEATPNEANEVAPKPLQGPSKKDWPGSHLTRMGP